MADLAQLAHHDRGRVRNALVLILIGGPIVVIDVTITRNAGRPFDILNDALGLGLIVWALSLLVNVPGPVTFLSRMRAVQLLGALLLAWSVVVQLEPTLAASPAVFLFSGIGVLGIILFCTGMRDLCAFHDFADSTLAWRRAASVAAVVLGIAWILSLVVSLVVTVTTGEGLATQLAGGAGFAVLLVLALAIVLVPSILVLLATTTLLGELRERSPIAPPGG